MPNHKGAIYQKKDCNGCKALKKGKCLLGYPILLERPEPTGNYSYHIPTEPCLKPRTQAKLQECISGLDEHKYKQFL